MKIRRLLPRRLLCLGLCLLLLGSIPCLSASAVEVDSYGNAAFASFEELEALVADSETDWYTAVYTGEDPLVISKDLSFPQGKSLDAKGCELVIREGVTFTTTGEFTSVYADSIIIEGTFLSGGCLCPTASLAVSGKLELESGFQIGYPFEISGNENISLAESAYMNVNCITATLEQLARIAADAAAESDDRLTYYIMYGPDEELTLTESLVLPGNVMWELYGAEFIIAQGVTLELNGTTYLSQPMTLEGGLINNGQLTIGYGFGGALTVADTGSVSGSGTITVRNDAEADLSAAVPGLDLSLFTLTKGTNDFGFFWELRPKTTAEKLNSLVADTTLTEAEALEAVQSLGAEELADAMAEDPAVSGQLEQLEQAISGGSAAVTVTGVEIDADQVSVIGANLNAAQAGETDITLVLSAPDEAADIPDGYTDAVAVSFSMTLTNVADTETLAVPVKITLPVPASVSPDNLVILHYHVSGGEPEVIQPTVTETQGQYFASFILTGFSDFVMTNRCVDHRWDEGTVDIAATCRQPGKKTYTCDHCHTTRTEELPQLTEHTYDNDCDESCNICGAVRTVQHQWDAGTTTDATCKAAGSTVYTCTLCGETRTETIDKLTTHTYDNDCDDSCNVCGEKRTTQHNWDSGKATKKPTCKTAGITTYTCTLCGETKTEIADKLTTHTYDNDCDESCNVCGVKRTVEHSYSTKWSSDSKNHWHECTDCGRKTDSAAHTPGAAATSYTAQKCTTCGYVIQAALGHSHTYSTRLSSDSENHWYECYTCYAKKDLAEHVYDDDCDDDCNDCGRTRKVVHVYDTELSRDETGHWYACTLCGEKKDFAKHTPGPEATEEAPQLCSDCGYEIAPKLEHTHSFEEPWSHDENVHWQTCTCGETSVPEAHVWDEGTENKDGSVTYICTECSAERTEEAPKSGSFPWWALALAGVAGGAAVIALVLKKKHIEF